MRAGHIKEVLSPVPNPACSKFDMFRSEVVTFNQQGPASTHPAIHLNGP